MRILAIDIDLLENRKLRSDFVPHVVFDGLVGVRLLVVELVAGERKDFEAFVSEFLVHLN